MSVQAWYVAMQAEKSFAPLFITSSPVLVLASNKLRCLCWLLLQYNYNMP
jgi:hypothetical protein